MFRKSLSTSLLVFVGLNFSVFAQEKTIITDANAKKMLLGKHLLSLQWISWDHFGKATVTDENGIFQIKGEQKAQKAADFLKIDGIITKIDAKEFTFEGEIIMKISHINNGEPCARTGEMTFLITGKRKYWRLQEMENPCDVTTDYVDIYFR